MALLSKHNRIVVSNRYTQTSHSRNGGLGIRLTLKKSIILLVILLLLLIWAFFVGVLVGQGLNDVEQSRSTGNATLAVEPEAESAAGSTLPEEALPPQVAQTAPAPQPDVPPEPTEEANAAQNTAEAEPENPQNAVISPEELSFMSELKDKPAPPQPGRVDSAIPAAHPGSQTAARTPPAQDSAANATGPEDTAPKATTPPGPGIFDYQYQVAATTDLEGAKRLVNQLRADGLRASMVQGTKDGGKIYRVHVDFRGTPSDTNQLREQLSKFGINRVLLKTKVATQ